MAQVYPRYGAKTRNASTNCASSFSAAGLADRGARTESRGSADKRDCGHAHTLYSSDRRLAKTANLVFQAPWATSNSADEPRRAVRRFSLPGRNTPSNTTRGIQSREEPRRRDLYDSGIGLRLSMAQRLQSSTTQGNHNSSSGAAFMDGFAAVKDAPRPICRNDQSPNAVVALDANFHFRPYMEDGYKILDRLFSTKEHQWGMYAVYDGHGGRAVTDSCLSILHELVRTQLIGLPDFPTPQTSDVLRSLEKSFVAMDESLKMKEAWNCGATCTVTLVHSTRGGRKLYVANVGDSRCVLVSGDKVVRTTLDHRACDPSEAIRVHKEGGIISRGRVGGQLMLTRALGDFALKHVGVSCRPYTSHHQLKPDDIVIIASDGLWDVLTDTEAGRLCTATRLQFGNEKIVAKTLVQQSLNLGSTDNITCVIVFT